MEAGGRQFADIGPVDPSSKTRMRRSKEEPGAGAAITPHSASHQPAPPTTQMRRRAQDTCRERPTLRCSNCRFSYREMGRRPIPACALAPLTSLQSCVPPGKIAGRAAHAFRPRMAACASRLSPCLALRRKR
ncbi:hypothetical protein Hsero_2498 [Herbaspirillum seropedicae SmR1]|uniref:Uncharacterized protein n=1 Tax=Herbaspirillum seropedicae (strain SmR1) TaxID=757424 RepID=D8IWH7_HERSS|nr:hypothetical protein Hsero_2498 [Herbaspirillum seropedicae SmR1]